MKGEGAVARKANLVLHKYDIFDRKVHVCARPDCFSMRPVSIRCDKFRYNFRCHDRLTGNCQVCRDNLGRGHMAALAALPPINLENETAFIGNNKSRA